MKVVNTPSVASTRATFIVFFMIEYEQFRHLLRCGGNYFLLAWKRATRRLSDSERSLAILRSWLMACRIIMPAMKDKQAMMTISYVFIVLYWLLVNVCEQQER